MVPFCNSMDLRRLWKQFKFHMGENYLPRTADKKEAEAYTYYGIYEN